MILLLIALGLWALAMIGAVLFVRHAIAEDRRHEDDWSDR